LFFPFEQNFAQKDLVGNLLAGRKNIEKRVRKEKKRKRKKKKRNRSKLNIPPLRNEGIRLFFTGNVSSKSRIKFK
jgi:hypothetical protein